MTKKGKIIFISGPSGVGKGTLIAALRERHPDYSFPPSCTTRLPRPDEIEGVTYCFVSREDFEKKIEDGEFLEYAQVHGGNFYGTLKAPLLDGVKNGKVVIREFDVQGFERARKLLPREDYVSVFIESAEGIGKLIRRIRARAPISEEELERRVVSMKKEMEHACDYDYVIASHGDDIERLISDAEGVISGAVDSGQ